MILGGAQVKQKGAFREWYYNTVVLSCTHSA
jgi:hypothetical protein